MTAPSRIDRFRTAVRRFQLNTGLGVLALVLGNTVAISLGERLGPRLSFAPTVLKYLLVNGLGWGTWCLGALPLIAWGTTRWLRLSAWSTALTAVGSGLLVQLSLQWLSGGTEWLTGVNLVGQLLFAGLGAWATAGAVAAGNLAREDVDAKARAEAQARAPEVAKSLEPEPVSPGVTPPGDGAA